LFQYKMASQKKDVRFLTAASNAFWRSCRFSRFISFPDSTSDSVTYSVLTCSHHTSIPSRQQVCTQRKLERATCRFGFDLLRRLARVVQLLPKPSEHLLHEQTTQKFKRSVFVCCALFCQNKLQTIHSPRRHSRAQMTPAPPRLMRESASLSERFSLRRACPEPVLVK
jgi:hypothetical protein